MVLCTMTVRASAMVRRKKSLVRLNNLVQVLVPLKASDNNE